jgi:hypothetical protein
MSDLFHLPTKGLLKQVCIPLLALLMLVRMAVAEELPFESVEPGKSEEFSVSPLPYVLPVIAESGSPGSRFWLSGEYLLWWFNDAPVPTPLLTTGPNEGQRTGVLNQPGTEVLLGGSSVATPVHSGLRVWAGSWLGQGNVGIEAGYLFIGPTSRQLQVGTTGLPGSANLAVPYFDNNGAGREGGTPGETVFVLPGPLQFNGKAIPGFQGSFVLGLSDFLQGAEANGVLRGFLGERLSLVPLLGFRWLELQESLSFSAATAGVPGGLFAGQYYNLFDRFAARNDFYGGQLGLRGEYRWGRVFVQTGVKVALGDVHQTVSVDCASQTSSGSLFFETMGTGGMLFPGGVFAQPSNIGLHTRDTFSVLPDVSVNIGYVLTPRLRLSLGYNFLALSSVARPGDEIDRVINSTRTGLAAVSQRTAGGPPPSGPVAPTFAFHDSSFWAQGLTFGMALQF